VTTPRLAREWLTPGVRGIGVASFLSDAGHEIPTSLLPSFLTATLGAPAAALGLVEGVADAAAGVAKLAGGPLADDPARRRAVAVGGYTVTALLSAAIAGASSVLQVAVCRTGAWLARGLRVPSRNALLADAVPARAYGRAYGFERAMDNAGAIVGPLLAVVLIAIVGVRGAIALSVIPGLLAAAAIVWAVRSLPRVARRHAPIRLRFRETLTGPLGRVFVAFAAFEAGNVAATLLILRATELLTPPHGADGAAQRALLLYAGYNAAATAASAPAGHLVDRRGGVVVGAAGCALFAAAYGGFAVAGSALLPLAVAFVTAGIAIGAVETAEHAVVAALAPAQLRGSAFGLLAALQSAGNLVASGVAGLLWTLASPSAAFGFATVCVATAAVLLARSSSRLPSAPSGPEDPA
jgi:MFS family permease